MRRLTRAALVGALSVAAVAVSAVPASAATGTLVIELGTDSTVYRNPAPRCYNRPAVRDVQIRNNTNSQVRLYRTMSCAGAPTETVRPGGFTISLVGSFYVVS
jgi:hypothetical protein